MKENNNCIDRKDKRLDEILKFFFLNFLEITKTIINETTAHKSKE